MANLTSSLGTQPSRTQPPGVQSCRRPSPPPGPVAHVQQIAHKVLSARAKKDSPPVTAHASSSSLGETRIESAAARGLLIFGITSDRSQRADDGFPKREPSPH